MRRRRARRRRPTARPSTEKAKALWVEEFADPEHPGHRQFRDDADALGARALRRRQGEDSHRQQRLSLDETGAVFFLTHETNAQEGLRSLSVLKPDRLPALGALLAVFVLAVILVGGWTGLRGLLALCASVLLVFYALLPGPRVWRWWREHSDLNPRVI